MLVQKLINPKLPIPLAELPEDGFCDERMIFAITEYQRRNLAALINPDGLISPGGATFRSISGAAAGGTAPATPSGRKFTTHANEVPTERTTPTARDVVSALKTAWSDLTETGARTLTAQFMGETGNGKYCFNWNLGNMKAKADVTHMYLRRVWEVVSEGSAEAHVASAGGQAHIATAEEIKKNGWGSHDGKAIVVFSPPHAQCRFRAFGSLQDGATKWIEHHKKIAAGDPGFLKSINKGDCPAVAKTLKKARYYTASEANYSRLMTSKKAEIDAALGPV